MQLLQAALEKKTKHGGRRRSASISAAEKISVGAAVAAVLSRLDGIFTLKEEQRTEIQPFSLRIKYFGFTSEFV